VRFSLVLGLRLRSPALGKFKKGEGEGLCCFYVCFMSLMHGEAAGNHNQPMVLHVAV
jgi:hypothetical protein